MNWTFCWLPFRELLGPPVRVLGDAEAGQPGQRLALRALGCLAVERPVVDELVEHVHPRVQAAFFGQVAPRPSRQLAGRPAVPADLAGVGTDDPETDPHGGRLARAVGAQEAEDLALGDLEGETVEGDGRAEALRDVIDLEAHVAEDSPLSGNTRPGRAAALPGGNAPCDRRTAYDRWVIDVRPVTIHADRAAGRLDLVWQDGHETSYDTVALRWLCPCAFCRGEAGMPGWLDSAPTLTAEQTRLVDIAMVGGYAIAPTWGDGHHTGYYTYTLLARPVSLSRGHCASRRPTTGRIRSASATRSTHDRRHHAIPVRPPSRREQRAWSSGWSSAAAGWAAT